MSRSLQRHLSISLGRAIATVGLLAALASFALAYFEAKEFQDDMLRQVAHFHVRERVTEPTQPDIETTGQVPLSDPESRISVVHLPRDKRPDWLSQDLAAGFHTLPDGTDRYRVFVLLTSNGERTVSAQLTDARNELAIDSALRTLVPLLILLPLLVWLIISIVRQKLAPIARISHELDQQPAERPTSIPTDGLPDEILPFAHAINRMFSRIETLIGQQRRFIADAAHELRTPLTALSLQARNLSHAKTVDAVQERGLALQAGIDRACKLTEQLLSLAATQAGANATTPIDVSRLVRDLMAQHMPLAETNGIDLGLDESAPMSLIGASDALRLILSNGLENALKYTPRGGDVTLRLMSTSNTDIIEIVDNGPGIPDDERERVIDAFYRIPGSPGSGSGPGLAIASEAATRLGGILSLHARPGGSGLIYRHSQRHPQ